MMIAALNFLDNMQYNKWNKITYYLLLPLSIIFEYYLYRKYWKIILDEIDSSEDLVDWLNEQEFGLKGSKLYKSDLIDSDSFLDTLDLVELQVKVKGEFAKKLVDLFQENLQVDIENYIEMKILTGYANSTTKIKQYSVIIRYYRYQYLLNSLKVLPLWLIGFSIPACIIYNIKNILILITNL